MRHRGMVAPIVAIKHYVNVENTSVTAGTARPMVVVNAVAQQSVTATNHVVEGSLVKAIFLELWIKPNGTAGNDTKFQFVFEKVPASQASITFTQMNNLMAYPNKKNVFFVSQGVLGDLTTQSIPVVRNWFKIPRGKQRMGAGDELTMTVSATNFTVDSCGVSTYKEYK